MKTLAIYPGTFDPFHEGHRDIYNKTCEIFGAENTLIVVGNNGGKERKSTVDRSLTIEAQLPSLENEVDVFDGLLTDYVREKEEEGFKVVVVRGLRNGHDLDYEVNQLRFMKDFKPDLKFIFIHCDPIHSHISSSKLKEIREVAGEAAVWKYIAKEE